MLSIVAKIMTKMDSMLSNAYDRVVKDHQHPLQMPAELFLVLRAKKVLVGARSQGVGAKSQ